MSHYCKQCNSSSSDGLCHCESSSVMSCDSSSVCSTQSAHVYIEPGCPADGDCGCPDKIEACKCEEKAAHSRKRTYRKVDAFNVETCKISYHPRLIHVPSNQYPDINTALASLRPNKGGYVIKLSCDVVHYLTQDVNECVDYLHIIGDDVPYTGVGYVNGARMDQSMAFFSTQDNGLGGYGPWRLMVTDNRITVTGDKNPDFTGAVGGKIARFFGYQVFPNPLPVPIFMNIIAAQGNTITVDQTLPLQGALEDGEGFVVMPKCQVIVPAPVKIVPTHMLRFTGIHWNIQNSLMAGSYGLYSAHYNNVFNGQLMSIGKINHQRPNAFFDRLHFGPNSSGFGIFQTIIGSRGQMLANSCGHIDWYGGVTALADVGHYLINGSNTNLFLGDHFLNCTSVYGAAGSITNIQGNIFHGNANGTRCFYQSVMAAHPFPEGLEQLNEFAPHFRNNFSACENYWQGYTIAQDSHVNFINNDIDFILDQQQRPVVLNNPVADQSSEMSMALVQHNPYVVDPPPDCPLLR